MTRDPTDRDGIAIVERAFNGARVRDIRRFPTGSAHFVYDILLHDNRSLVARVMRPDQAKDVVSALYWHGQVAPLGVPLPRLYGHEAEPPPDAFPFLLLERLPGTDLGEVYPALSRAEKRALARRVVTIQHAAGTLPEGSGFGYARSFDDPDLHLTWTDVVRADLARSRNRILAVGLASPAIVDRVGVAVARWTGVMDAVRPRAFLDDTTTKNVIVHRGRLSGIVDVDVVCFGDPLWTLALTRMALLARGWDHDYTDAWAEELGLDAEKQSLLDVYTAVFGVNFLGELGHRFNRETAAPVDPAQVRHLTGLVEGLLAGR